MNRQRRTAIALLLTPLACVGIIPLSSVIATVVADQSTPLYTPLLATVTGILAVVLAVSVARWARHTALTGPLRTALGILMPIGVAAGLLLYPLTSNTKLAQAAPGLLLWLAGLTLVLWGAGLLAQRGRISAAWWLGILGAITVADLAVVLTVIINIPPESPPLLIAGPHADAADRISAPLWLFVTYTDWAFGLPRPTGWEIILITDLIEAEPFLYLAWTPYALAYAIGAARQKPIQPAGLTSPGPSPTPSPSTAC